MNSSPSSLQLYIFLKKGNKTWRHWEDNTTETCLHISEPREYIYMHVNIYTYAYMYIYKYMSNLQTYMCFCTFAASFAVQRPLQAPPPQTHSTIYIHNVQFG